MTHAEASEDGLRGFDVTPAEITRSSAPGICRPAGPSSVNRAFEYEPVGIERQPRREPA